MPWSVKNPPSCAKNWTDAEKAKCVKTANAVLRDGGSDQDAIFGCIRAAGKTKHPGGQDAQGADGLGRMGGPEAGGPGGQCVCPKCGYKASHDTGEPCYDMTCPKCGAKMTRQAVQGSLALEPVTAEDLEEYSNHTLLADYKPKELLKFKDAHLCSAGTNKNGDWIDENGIKELASTMHFLAIDDEHDEQKVIGFFVHPRADATKLITDGVIYARRFPEITRQIQSGEKKLSVEAVAQTAICSVCGGEYTSYKDYCEHLLDKQKFGAQRKLFGLRARGGATVLHPAWDTSFDANGFLMIASQMEFEPKEDDAVLSLWAKIENKLDAYLQKLKPVSIEGGEDITNDLLAAELLSQAVEALGWDAAKRKEKWSKGIDLKEGSLTALGWPNFNKLASAVRTGKVTYKNLIGKLGFLRNITKDTATKQKAANFMERLRKMFRKEGSKTKGGENVTENTILEGEGLEELKERLGLVEGAELETVQAELVAKDAEVKAEVEKTKLGFERAAEMGLGADAAPILGNLTEAAYELFKAQKAASVGGVEGEADPEADPGEGDPVGAEVKADDGADPQEIKAGELQGAVLGDGAVKADPLTWAGYPDLFPK